MDNSRIFSIFASQFNKDKNISMRKIYLIVLLILAVCISCQWNLRPADGSEEMGDISIERFDRMEMLYLMTGDIAALQQMKTTYPAQTRTLIEDVLHLGMVDEPNINSRFLMFFQDSTLQAMMADVDREYGEIDDLNRQLTHSFRQLTRLLPDLPVPVVYTQVGSLDQSVIVGDGMLGISLDKYLGEDYPVYLRYGYTAEQRRMMTRRYIVPDCLGFYLLRHYPLPESAEDSVPLRHEHMSRIQYVVNTVMGKKIFTHGRVTEIETYMHAHPDVSVDELLSSDALPQ